MYGCGLLLLADEDIPRQPSFSPSLTKARVFTPSPVPTGEGRDEGELEQVWCEIYEQRHRVMLWLLAVNWRPCKMLVNLAHTAARPSPGTPCHPLPRRRGRGFLLLLPF